jgi:predicted SAM-dependent methyltransferase
MIATGLRLDLGCGNKTKPGYQGVDVEPLSGVLCVDLLRFPWPWPDASVEEAYCSHFFEHVPAKLRPVFMDELWRILQPNGTALIVVPKWDSPGAVQDFTHEWPPVAPQSFLYFNRDARKLMGLEHYPCSCHFDAKVREFVEYIPQTEVRLVKLA